MFGLHRVVGMVRDYLYVFESVHWATTYFVTRVCVVPSPDFCCLSSCDHPFREIILRCTVWRLFCKSTTTLFAWIQNNSESSRLSTRALL